MTIKRYAGDRFSYNSLNDPEPTGVLSGALLLDLKDGSIKYYDGTNWELTAGSAGAVWGNITGTLSAQTDLQTALDNKANIGHTHSTSDITSGVFTYARLPINATQVSNWDTAYSWGDHSAENYLKDITNQSIGDLNDVTISTFVTGQFLRWNGSALVNTALTASDIPNLDASKINSGVFSYDRLPISSTQVSNWDTAYSWGDHSTQGYLTDITNQPIGNLSNVTTTSLAIGNLLRWNGTSFVNTMLIASDIPNLDASKINSGVFSYDRLPISSTQVANWDTAYSWGNHSTEGYLKDITNEEIGDLSNVTTISLTTGNLLRWNGTAFVNTMLTVSDIPNLDASKITSGTFADARISQSSVTQHQAALSITAGQITGLATVATSGDYNDLTNKPDLSALADVLSYTNFAAFPATGETGKLYIAQDTGYLYRWSGSAYVQLTDQTAIWGQISGTLSNQTDLQNALNSKAEVAGSNTQVQYNNFGDLGASANFTWNNTDSRLTATGSIRIKEGGTIGTPANNEADYFVETEVVGQNTITRLMAKLGNGDNVIIASYIQ